MVVEKYKVHCTIIMYLHSYRAESCWNHGIVAGKRSKVANKQCLATSAKDTERHVDNTFSSGWSHIKYWMWNTWKSDDLMSRNEKYGLNTVKCFVFAPLNFHTAVFRNQFACVEFTQHSFPDINLLRSDLVVPLL